MTIWLDVALIGAGGLAVVAATVAARRWNGMMGGIAAAAPITPTFAILAAGGTLPDLTVGLPVITATLAALALWIHARRAPIPLLVVILVPAFALVLQGAPTGLVLLATMVLAALVHGLFRPYANNGPGPRGLSVSARFAVGAAGPGLVILTREVAPALTPFVALLPLLFVASITAAHMGGGNAAAQRMAYGGAAGAIGVTGFAVAATAASPWGSTAMIALGWVAFAACALAWRSMAEAITPKAPNPPAPVRRPPRPVPATAATVRVEVKIPDDRV